MDQTEKQIAETLSRIEALEGIVSKLADQVLQLEGILNAIADKILPEDENTD